MDSIAVAKFVTPTLFAVLVPIFAGLALRDLFRHPTTPSPARRTWMRMAVVFALVSIVLFGMQCR
jgi:hypothetical protein